MIAALLAAGVCLAPPYYDSDLSGPTCTAANQETECRCSECATWEPLPGADWYDLQRTDQDGTFHQVIGSSKIIYSYTDDDGIFHPAISLNWYCFAMDASTPVDGRRYVYKIRACASAWTPTCGAWSTGSIVYVGAPITCYDNGKAVACPSIP